MSNRKLRHDLEEANKKIEQLANELEALRDELRARPSVTYYLAPPPPPLPPQDSSIYGIYAQASRAQLSAQGQFTQQDNAYNQYLLSRRW